MSFLHILCQKYSSSELTFQLEMKKRKKKEKWSAKWRTHIYEIILQFVSTYEVGR